MSPVSVIDYDAEGTLWVGTTRFGWLAYREGRLERFAGAAPGATTPGSAGHELLSEPDGSTWRTQGVWLYRTAVDGGGVPDASARGD